jgi:hypothetical protein
VVLPSAKGITFKIRCVATQLMIAFLASEGQRQCALQMELKMPGVIG